MSIRRYQFSTEKVEKVVNAQIPDVLHWLFLFGFKIGILLLIKNIVLLSYDWPALSNFGRGLILSQILLALEFLWIGLNMERTKRLWPSILLWIPSVVTGVMWRLGTYPYYSYSEETNLFKKLLENTVSKVSNIGGSVYFIDTGVWVTFGIVLNIILILYLFSSLRKRPSLSVPNRQERMAA